MNFSSTTFFLMGGLGEKTKRQITNAINKYGSNHGIIISNTTDVITKEDNVIYIQ